MEPVLLDKSHDRRLLRRRQRLADHQHERGIVAGRRSTGDGPKAYQCLGDRREIIGAVGDQEAGTVARVMPGPVHERLDQGEVARLRCALGPAGPRRKTAEVPDDQLGQPVNPPASW